uniref:Uncharacterized protein n=1 Tax=Oryza rufipogon TaxID=4529 RepID=A0A0E0PS97_ORYRU
MHTQCLHTGNSLEPQQKKMLADSLRQRMPGGWGARRGEVGEDIRRAGDAAAAASSSTMREKGERHRLTARATSRSGHQRGPGGGGEDAKARDSGWRRRHTTRCGRRFGTN